MNYRVLSIQSHVVHGYVGNRSAVFPLQVLGIEVDFINSVHFSNHTGYNTVEGQVLDAEDLKTVYRGLKANGLNRYTHVLTGYVGSASFLETVAEIIKDLKSENPNLKYFCDPVLGDSDELYVPAELVPIYKEKILPLADVILPNQFEAELLTASKIHDEASALDCIHQLHMQFNVPIVILSSTNITYRGLPPNKDAYSQQDIMLGFASRRFDAHRQSGDSQPAQSEELQLNGRKTEDAFEQVRFRIPVLDGVFRGTGDLFAALTLAHLEGTKGKRDAFSSMITTFEQVISTMQAVLRRTLLMAEQSATLNPSIQTSAQLELKLIQSMDDIRNPPGGCYVEPITHKL